MGLYANRVVKIATEEIGYREKETCEYLDSKLANAGDKNFTKYARDLWSASPHFYQSSKQGFDWCCVFVDWCLYKASGFDSTLAQEAKYYTGPYGAGCEYAAMYYQNAGAWYDKPMPGDQVFFGRYNSYQHTGLVEQVDGDYVWVIEGNCDNSVKAKKYSLNDPYIIGYGRPKYDTPVPASNPFVDVPSDEWYYDAVTWAYNEGITSGVDSTHFDPNRPATRAEVVQMLYKMSK